MPSLYLHPQDVWHCTLKTRPYTLLFVKKYLEIQSSSNKSVSVLIFLNDLPSTSRWMPFGHPATGPPNPPIATDTGIWFFWAQPTRCNVIQYSLWLSMLYMFQAVSSPIIRSSKLYTQLDIYQMLCVQFWAPDVGCRNRLKHVEHWQS
jgi:hypothetical protein